MTKKNLSKRVTSFHVSAPTQPGCLANPDSCIPRLRGRGEHARDLARMWATNHILYGPSAVRCRWGAPLLWPAAPRGAPPVTWQRHKWIFLSTRPAIPSEFRRGKPTSFFSMFCQRYGNLQLSSVATLRQQVGVIEIACCTVHCWWVANVSAHQEWAVQ
jgi:hypothetical protein